MNATQNPPKLQSEVVEHVMHEHDLLQEKVRQIHSALAAADPAPAEIETLLREFLSALIVHFSTEEEKSEGFFTEICGHAPRLSGQADQLCVEHQQLLHQANELCQFAASGSPSLTWWRELKTRCHEFSKRLMNHEREENKLLQEAYQADIGAYD